MADLPVAKKNDFDGRHIWFFVIHSYTDTSNFDPSCT